MTWQQQVWDADKRGGEAGSPPRPAWLWRPGPSRGASLPGHVAGRHRGGGIAPTSPRVVTPPRWQTPAAGAGKPVSGGRRGSLLGGAGFRPVAPVAGEPVCCGRARGSTVKGDGRWPRSSRANRFKPRWKQGPASACQAGCLPEEAPPCLSPGGFCEMAGLLGLKPGLPAWASGNTGRYLSFLGPAVTSVPGCLFQVGEGQTAAPFQSKEQRSRLWCLRAPGVARGCWWSLPPVGPAHPAFRAAPATALVSQDVPSVPPGCKLMKRAKSSGDYLPKWSLHWRLLEVWIHLLSIATRTVISVSA